MSYKPIIATAPDNYNAEIGPDGPLNPETGKPYTAEEGADQLMAARRNANNLYGLPSGAEDALDDANNSRSKGVTTEGIVDSLGAAGTEIGSRAEVRTVAAKMDATGDTRLAKEISYQTRDISDKLEVFSGNSESVGETQVRNRLAAEALKAFAANKTDGKPGIFNQEMRNNVESSSIGAAMVDNADGIQNNMLKGWAKQIENKRGGAESASNDDLELLGERAKNAGVTLENIEEEIDPNAEMKEEKADEKIEFTERDGESGVEDAEEEGPKEEASDSPDEDKDLLELRSEEKDKSADVSMTNVMRAAEAGRVDDIVNFIAKGNEDMLPRARKLALQLVTDFDVAKALRGYRDIDEAIEDQANVKRWKPIIDKMMKESLEAETQDKYDLAA